MWWLGLQTTVEVGSVKAASPSWMLTMYAFSLSSRNYNGTLKQAAELRDYESEAQLHLAEVL